MAAPIVDDIDVGVDDTDAVPPNGEEVDDDVGGRNALLVEQLMRLLLLLMLLLLLEADEVMDMLEGPHCSIARNRSRSHRRSTSSRTERLRCGNSWTSISIALGDTIEWFSAMENRI